MNGIFVCVPVWGENHVNRLLDVAIPCLLAEGNLPTLARIYRVAMVIYTNEYDAEVLRASSRMKALEAVIDVVYETYGHNPAEMVQILHPGFGHGGTVMKICHNYGIVRAWKAGFGLCPIVADEFFSNAWGETILYCLKTGRRAVMEVGYALPNTFLEVLDRHRKGDVISISPRDASREMIKLINPPSIAEHDDRQWRLLWGALSGHGFLMRPHHIPVDFIWPTKGPVWCNRSQDNDFAHQALDTPNDVLLITSSLQSVNGGIEGMGNSAPPKPTSWDAARAACVNAELQAVWLKHACNDWHKQWMSTNFWCEDGELGTDERKYIEDHAAAVVAECFVQYDNLMAGRGRAEMHAADREISTWW